MDTPRYNAWMRCLQRADDVRPRRKLVASALTILSHLTDRPALPEAAIDLDTDRSLDALIEACGGNERLALYYAVCMFASTLDEAPAPA